MSSTQTNTAPSSSMLAGWIEKYRAEQVAVMDSIPTDAVAKLVNHLRRIHIEDRQVFCFGNGGSAANCSHFATDLGKGSSDKLGKRFRVLCLNDNMAWITALGNDYSYDEVYSRQLMNYARPGDLALTLSVSGNSPNLVKAFEWAKEHGVYTVAIVGAKRGRLATLADEAIVINSEHYGRVEDAHMAICHMLCYVFIENPQIAK